MIPGVEHELRIFAPDRASHVVSEVRVQSGETLPLEIVLPAPRWFDVQVVEDSSGKPISGASLSSYVHTSSGSWNGDEEARRWLDKNRGIPHSEILAELGISPAEIDAYREPA